MKIIHHNDLDGYVAGSIVKVKYPKAECYSVNYDNTELLPKKEDFKEGEVVFMVDYTIEDVDLMNWMIEHTKLYWIDHHKTSLEKEKKYGWDKVRGIRKVGSCGAELCWGYFFKGELLPKFVRLVGDYDTFRFADKPIHEKIVLPFAFGAMSIMDKMKPENYDRKDFCSRIKKVSIIILDVLKKVKSFMLIRKYKVK